MSKLGKRDKIQRDEDDSPETSKVIVKDSKKSKVEKVDRKSKDKESKKEKKSKKTKEVEESSEKEEVSEEEDDLLEVDTRTPQEIEGDFKNFPICAKSVEVLIKNGIKFLFPIQSNTFKNVYDGYDLIGRDRTGSGKT